MAIRNLLFLSEQGFVSEQTNLQINTDSGVRTVRVGDASNDFKLTGLADGTSANHAATYGQLLAVERGLDYKQEVKAIVSAITKPVGASAGDRYLVLVSGTGSSNTTNGIYYLADAGDTNLSRAADMAVGSDAAGAFVYNAGTGLQYVCTNGKGSAIVGTDALTFVSYGAGASYTFSSPLAESGGTVSLNYGNGLEVATGSLVAKAYTAHAITVDANGIGVNIASNRPIYFNSNALDLRYGSTLGIDGSYQLKVVGVPAQFEIGGSATSANVTAANVNTLVGGSSTDAGSLHSHKVVKETITGITSTSGFAAGLAVRWDATNKIVLADKGSDAGSHVIGIIESFVTDTSAVIVKGGQADLGTLAGTLAINDPVYLGSSGTNIAYSSLGSGDFAVLLGYVQDVTGHLIDLNPRVVGQKA
jgi:hypothetical protein